MAVRPDIAAGFRIFHLTSAYPAVVTGAMSKSE
jgi:hypothetical protein